MEKHEKIQIIEDFLITMEKTDELEKNNSSIPSVACQYKHKKEELFDNFVLSIMQLMPQETMNFWGSLKLLFFILKEREKLSIYPELRLDKFLMHIIEKAEHFYDEEEDDEAKRISDQLKHNINLFVSKLKLLMYIMESEWDFVHFSEKDTRVTAFAESRSSLFDFHFHMRKDKDQKNTASFSDIESTFMKISEMKNITFENFQDLF